MSRRDCPAEQRVVEYLCGLGAADKPVNASVLSISRGTNLHRGTVHRAIASLEESGFIERRGAAHRTGTFRLYPEGAALPQHDPAPEVPWFWRDIMLAAGIRALRQADQPSQIGRHPTPIGAADIVNILNREGPICDDAIATILSEPGPAISRQTVSRRRASVRRLAASIVTVLTRAQFTALVAQQIATMLVRIAEKNPTAAPPPL